MTSVSVNGAALQTRHGQASSKAHWQCQAFLLVSCPPPITAGGAETPGELGSDTLCDQRSLQRVPGNMTLRALEG